MENQKMEEQDVQGFKKIRKKQRNNRKVVIEKIQEDSPTMSNNFAVLENQLEIPTDDETMENIDQTPLPQEPSNQ